MTQLQHVFLGLGIDDMLRRELQSVISSCTSKLYLEGTICTSGKLGHFQNYWICFKVKLWRGEEVLEFCDEDSHVPHVQLIAQLNCIVCCQHTNTKDIAGQSATTCAPCHVEMRIDMGRWMKVMICLIQPKLPKHHHHHHHQHHHHDQVTAPTPSLGSHGSGEGDSTYFTGERPSPHHLSVLSEFKYFSCFSNFFSNYLLTFPASLQCAKQASIFFSSQFDIFKGTTFCTKTDVLHIVKIIENKK